MQLASLHHRFVAVLVCVVAAASFGAVQGCSRSGDAEKAPTSQAPQASNTSSVSKPSAASDPQSLLQSLKQSSIPTRGLLPGCIHDGTKEKTLGEWITTTAASNEVEWTCESTGVDGQPCALSISWEQCDEPDPCFYTVISLDVTFRAGEIDRSSLRCSIDLTFPDE